MRTRHRNTARPAAPRARRVAARLCAGIAAVLLGVLSTARAAETPAGGPNSAATPASAVRPVPGGMAAENLAIITIDGPIDGVTARSFERRMQRAIEGGADAVVIELDTPGGEVPAVLTMCGIIETCPVRTVAWIHPNAYSGGAIMALACDEIVLGAGAALGDAAPVQFDPLRGISKIEDAELRQKQMAPILAQVVDSARQHGYDEVLVQGMVSLGVRTWMVEDVRDGRMHFLTDVEYRQLFGEAPAIGQPMVASGGETNAYTVTPLDVTIEAQNSITAFKPASGQFDQALTTMVSKSLDGRTATSRPDFSKEDSANYQPVGYATDGAALLTMKGGLLRTFGFVTHPADIDTDADIQAYFGATNIVRLNQTWIETAVGFMTQGISGLLIRGALIVVFLLAMFIELSMPGLGVPGLVALCALGLLVVPSMLLGASMWWAVGSIVGGVGLIILEVLVFPGFGIPGLLGLVMLLGGLVGTFMTGGQLFPGVGTSTVMQLFWAISTVLLALFAAGAAMFFVSKYTRSIPIASKLVLFESVSSPSASSSAAVSPSAKGGAVGIGAVGVTTTPLRPSGTAEFGDDLVDVVADVGFVESGVRVRVVSASAFRVVVEPDEAAGAAGPGDRSA